MTGRQKRLSPYLSRLVRSSGVSKKNSRLLAELFLGYCSAKPTCTISVRKMSVLVLNPYALTDDREYVRLIETLQNHGYAQRKNLRPFQLVRTVPTIDDGPEIDVVVDFLMPRDAETTRNSPPLVDRFAVQRADGANLAIRFKVMIVIEGYMPEALTTVLMSRCHRFQPFWL